METPRSLSNDLGKKTRATSCTACRQLKCDLKERYPSPCTRCTANHSECKTDASFKRIPARSRIKDLENQIDQLKRNRALEVPTPNNQSGDLSIELGHWASSDGRADDLLSGRSRSAPLSYSSPSESDFSRGEVKWLNIMEADISTSFVLEDVALPYSHALELFQHFEDYYFANFCILESITSIRQLYQESSFLFWSIVFISSRYHRRHGPYFSQLWTTVQKLCGQSIEESCRCILDLQAILLHCTYPCHSSQGHDPGWVRLGTAINAAKQLGLDKAAGEVTFDTHKAQRSYNNHTVHTRQLVWMKCFELDVQMSLWYGHVPSLASPHSLRTVVNFCDNIAAHSAYAATVSIYVELARSLITLEEDLKGNPEAHVYLMRMFNERLHAVKTKWASRWSLDTEFELLTAKLYLQGACLVHLEDSVSLRGVDGTHIELSQSLQSVAVQLVNLQTNMNTEAIQYAVSGHLPLLGSPVHTLRSSFFAACVLLKCLDEPKSSADDGRDVARNAFGRIFQLFSKFPPPKGAGEMTNARPLEIVGRAVGEGRGQIRPNVTTRMGASIRLNVLWLATEASSQEAFSDVAQDSANLVLDGPILVSPMPAQTSVPFEPYIYPDATTSCGAIVFNDSLWNISGVVLPGLDVPYGIWDDGSLGTWESSMPDPV